MNVKSQRFRLHNICPYLVPFHNKSALSFLPSINQSINQSCICRVVQVIKSFRIHWMWGIIYRGSLIMSRNEAWNRNVFKRRGKVDRDWGWYHVVRQAVPDGGSGDWEGPAAGGRQFHRRYQRTIGPSRAERTSAINVTLLAFAVCRAAAPLPLGDGSRRCRSISPASTVLSSKPAAALLCRQCQ